MISSLSFIDEYHGIGIIYEDNHLLVVHKPRNIPVQADESGDCSIQTELQDFLKLKHQKPGNVFLGIVHRLDRPVSGIMVFAKTSKAASRLSDQIRRQTFQKKYFALVEGVPEKTSAILSDYLKKDSKTNKVSVVKAGTNHAQIAELSYTLLANQHHISLLEIDLKTGRPHQIRIQLAHLGYPIVGDAKYGNAKGRSDAIELKAIKLAFEHPTTKEFLTFEGIKADTDLWEKF